MTENEATEELKNDCNELGKTISRDTSCGMSMNEVYRLTVKALEKQIPKKQFDDIAFVLSQNCRRKFNSELVNEYDMKYCLHCGQALE